MSEVHSIIHIDPEILGGKPVFKGTRVPVEILFEYLETSSLNDFLEGFPTVTREQAESAIELAGQLLTSLKEVYENSPG